MNIIIAEDNPASRKLLETHLKKDGYQTFPARDGFEAWQLVQKKKARIIISDWMMPGLNGLELCRKIRSARFPDYFYVIILTAKTEKADIIKGLEAGADDFLIKPVNPEELLARIRSGKRIIALEDMRKQAMTKLYQSDKMVAIGQLAAGVAHEINNPLGFISSNIITLAEYKTDVKKIMLQYQSLLDLLEVTEVPSVIQQKARNIRRIENEIDLHFIMDDLDALLDDCREGTERIRKIVLDLKNFSRPGDDDQLKWMDINKSLESTLNVMRCDLKQKAEITMNFGEIPPVHCYPQQINQVFMNILINAVQAIENKGEITISTKAMDNNAVEVSVEDSGAGIEEALLPKIFDPFFTTKKVGEGTGMGLNVAYNIIKNHGGTISARSKAGQGTIFTVRIPVESS